MKKTMELRERHGSFEAELGAFLASYDPYAEEYFDSKIESAKKYSPVISDSYKKLKEFSSGGKKMRACLVWLGYQIGGGTGLTKVLPICLSFEMTQNFLLIHDDIIDNSPKRRNKPTIHKTYGRRFGPHYGESMAIVLGDIASIEVFDIVNSSSFSSDQKVMCQRLLANVLLETAYGQSLDVEFSYKRPRRSQIMQIADLKAARYSVIAPLVIGASLAGAAKGQIEALEKYGSAAGLAFQFADDILGVFGTEEVVGKSILSDMREGKNTLLIYQTKRLAKGKDGRDIERIWGKKDATVADLKKVRKIIEESGALEWCKQENLRLTAAAKGEIKAVTEDERLGTILAQVADFVVDRRK